jgi:hypothetical protein
MGTVHDSISLNCHSSEAMGWNFTRPQQHMCIVPPHVMHAQLITLDTSHYMQSIKNDLILHMFVLNLVEIKIKDF